MRDHLSMHLSEKKRRWILSLATVCCALPTSLCVSPQQAVAADYQHPVAARDSIPAKEQDTTIMISNYDVINTNNRRLITTVFKNNDTLAIKQVALYPYTSVQQMMKGNIRGLYIQEPSGEPGTEQFMYVRGLSMPLLSKKDVYQVQPAVFINGIPLIQDNTIIFDIQRSDRNRLGPATNLLAIVNPDNIREIQVLKDAAAISLFSPRGANGIINIITKNATSGQRQISVNSYFGINLYDPVYTTNAQYENRFRKPYYEKYAKPGDLLSFPAYLRDSSNMSYFGRSNWTDLYFRNTTQHSVNASISGGSERANFRFFGDETRANGIADNTRLDKYTASFIVNMSPIKWLMASAMINATRMDRVRNRSMQDRFTETAYIPDISSPLSPDKSAYSDYLDAFRKGFDKNSVNSIQGNFSLVFALDHLRYTSRLLYDYNENRRNVFWPTTLMDGANYASNYFGNNQRVGFENVVDCQYSPSDDHQFNFEVGQLFQADLYKYTYDRAYKGISDRIKVNIIESDQNKDTYLQPLYFANQLTYRFIDNEKQRLLSFHGNVRYSYHNIYRLSFTIRSTGSSLMAPSVRWLITPAIGGEWNLKNHFFKDMTALSDLILHASWGRIGRLPGDDRYAAGPQYKVDMGNSGNPNLFSYAGVAGISRPYSYGWIGENINWAYTDILTVGTNVSFFNNRLRMEADYYSKDDQQMLLPMPVVAESGYVNAYMSGMHVNNSGVELGISGEVIHTKKFQWTPGISAAYNKNKLKALPDGAKELIIGDHKFEVGKAIDQFWLYENQGIYNNASEIPVDPKTNAPLSFKGVPFSVGDAKWRDVNGDYIIDDKDKVMTGHSMPVYIGNFTNTLRYGHLDFSFSFYFAAGQSILNSKTATRLDFINHDGQSNMESVKDITYWQRSQDMKTYPLYNPWSPVVPYRADQDLFLERGSFVKLRTISAGYDLAGTKWLSRLAPGIKRCYVYATGNNLLTFSSYTGGDPELTSYNGYDNGYVIPMPKTYTIGLKLDL